MTSQRHIAMLVAYDGGAWSGSQRQDNAPTVQGELERALELVLKHPTPVVLAGRTDAGVHATGQVARFSTENQSLPVEKVPLALNGVLNKSVRVREAREVAEDFHPRFSARRRVYCYWIEQGATQNPLLRGLTALVRDGLDVEQMRATASAFVGEHDFAAWQSAGSPVPTTVREVVKCEIRELDESFGSRLLEIEIEANAFLYQMVRNIVGALLEAGRGRLDAGEIRRLTEGKDRTNCPPPAPPQGLCLVQVKYEE